VWRGTSSHQGDIFDVKDQLDELIAGMPEVDFFFLGYNPWMLAQQDNLYVVESMSLMEYFQALDSLAADVLIVQLEDSTFNRCKSNIAQLETARAGTTVVGPSWLEWADCSEVLHYDKFGSMYEAVNWAFTDRREQEPAYFSTKWGNGRSPWLLTEVNQQREYIIERLLNAGFV
jgi:hypothetical protein